ncbi:MAG: metal-sulfur cluster assembly factor [Bryobacteraceae bacterium]|nr:metal-sulfur cluster assembly factor [Bryobacteraceae bacterium]
MSESEYWQRTDSVEEKVRLIETAFKKGDFRVARALAESLKDTIRFAQQENESIGEAAVAADEYVRVADLPEPWRRWARGWAYSKPVALDETVALAREGEPVEFVAAFRADQTESLRREVRVAAVEKSGALREVPCQVSSEIRRGGERRCRITLLAASPAHTRTSYLVFYGNPNAELTDYPTDLKVTGEGFALDIENDHYRASLSRQMGQLERLTLKREHGLELFAGGEGHAEPPGIDWAHDYVTAGNFQKMRVTNWATCPDYEVIRGPLSVTVRRWGFPHSPVHPVFSPSRIHMFVEYRFYAGAPYFVKTGRMEALKDLDITYMRDDEWVFSGYSFTDTLWMGPDGKLREGPVDPGRADDLWATGFYNRTSRDAFIGLFLEHEAENVSGLKHPGAPVLSYRWHGAVWSRQLFHNSALPAGAVLKQKNAYLVAAFPETGGAEMVQRFRRRLLNPLAVSAADLSRGAHAASGTGALARSGEAGDSLVDKRLIWEALRDCKDEQLYTANANVVDLGLIYDVRVRGDAVHIVMTTPHRGRPRYGYYAWGSGGNSQPVRDRLLKVPGVRKVVVEPAWNPPWDANRLTESGRKALGLP